jgi:hypothetical protein
MGSSDFVTVGPYNFTMEKGISTIQLLCVQPGFQLATIGVEFVKELSSAVPPPATNCTSQTTTTGMDITTGAATTGTDNESNTAIHNAASLFGSLLVVFAFYVLKL